jgi:hypothetical protein
MVLGVIMQVFCSTISHAQVNSISGKCSLSDVGSGGHAGTEITLFQGSVPTLGNVTIILVHPVLAYLSSFVELDLDDFVRYRNRLPQTRFALSQN